MHCFTVGLHDRRTSKFGLFQGFSTVEIMKQQMKWFVPRFFNCWNYETANEI